MTNNTQLSAGLSTTSSTTSSTFWEQAKSYCRILKANLSWTRKKSNSSDAKLVLSVFVSFFFWIKSRTSDTQVWVLLG